MMPAAITPMATPVAILTTVKFRLGRQSFIYLLLFPDFVLDFVVHRVARCSSEYLPLISSIRARLYRISLRQCTAQLGYPQNSNRNVHLRPAKAAISMISAR